MNIFIDILKILGMFACAYCIPATIFIVVLWKAKKIKEDKPGFTWHCHHDLLLEYCYDYRDRIKYIKRDKPKAERKIRLKLFKFVKGVLPVEVVEAGKKYGIALHHYCETRLSYEECKRTYAHFKMILNKHRPLIMSLHEKECGCGRWDGYEIKFLLKRKKMWIRRK